jgi:hypothetical protein
VKEKPHSDLAWLEQFAVEGSLLSAWLEQSSQSAVVETLLSDLALLEQFVVEVRPPYEAALRSRV